MLSVAQVLNLESQVELTEPSARLHQYPDSHSPCSVLHALHPVLSATLLNELSVVHNSSPVDMMIGSSYEHVETRVREEQ